MTSVIADLSPLLLLAALFIGGLTLLSTRRIQVALPVFADLLLAVGLLRLSATGSWQAIGSAAALVAVRKIATYGISRAVDAHDR